MPEANQTEKATPQRRKKAREQGGIARSRELPSLLALVGALSALTMAKEGMALHWRTFYVGLLNAASEDRLTAEGPIFFWTSLEALRWLTPILLAALCCSTAAGLVQGGVHIAPAALQPKFERLSPAGRVKQIFSSATLSGVAKSLLPFGAILLVGVSSLRDRWPDLQRASQMDPHSFVPLITSTVFAITWKAVLILLGWSAIDYFLVWRRNESQMRMSKEEVKREHKENDGNPHTKQQVRKIQRAMRRKRSLKAVPTATLVVTNPTHYAVALRYEPPMAAPEVIAKGRDLLALKIKEIAREHDITVMENKPLAQALYKTVEVGESIPAQLYQAVAEVLVVVYRAQAELREAERIRRTKNAAGEVKQQA